MSFKREKRERRHRRVRAKVAGSGQRPRLAVFRSSKHTHLQLIDDVSGKTLAAASTREAAKVKGKTEQAVAAAKLLAQRAVKLGVKQAVFDRGGYKYHGRVKSIAEACRQAGLKI